MPPAAPLITGRGDIANFWQGAMDSGLTLARTELLEVIENGDLAVDTGVIYLNGPDGSRGMVEVAMKYVVAWQKGEDGVWCLHHDAWNAM